MEFLRTETLEWYLKRKTRAQLRRFLFRSEKIFFNFIEIYSSRHQIPKTESKYLLESGKGKERTADQ